MCIFAFSGNFIVRFYGNEFSQDLSGQYSLKCHVWEKCKLLHGFAECSFFLNIWQFGMIIVDIPSVLDVLLVVLEIEKEMLLLVIVYCMAGPLGTLIDDFILLTN